MSALRDAQMNSGVDRVVSGVVSGVIPFRPRGVRGLSRWHGITPRASNGEPVCVMPPVGINSRSSGHVSWCTAGTRLGAERLGRERLRVQVSRGTTSKRDHARARGLADGVFPSLFQLGKPVVMEAN